MSIKMQIDRVSNEVSAQADIIGDMQTLLGQEDTASGTPLERNTENLSRLRARLGTLQTGTKVYLVRWTAADVG